MYICVACNFVQELSILSGGQPLHWTDVCLIGENMWVCESRKVLGIWLCGKNIVSTSGLALELASQGLYTRMTYEYNFMMAEEDQGKV